MSGKPRNPDEISPGDWTESESSNNRLYALHLGWLHEMLSDLTQFLRTPDIVSGSIDVRAMKQVLYKLGRFRAAYAHVERVLLMLALKRARLTVREAAGLLGVGHATVNRWALAFADPADFEPERVTAQMNLNAAELASLIEHYYGSAFTQRRVNTWDPNSPDFERYELDLVPLDTAPPEHQAPLGSEHFLARTLQDVGWIVPEGDKGLTIRWSLLPPTASDALHALQPHWP